MSHTNHTQYYELPQYVGSDIINPLVDTNGAYEKIDTTMHNIAAEAAQDTADVATLQSKVGSGVFDTTAQNATDAVNELVGELNTADTGVKARLTTAESDIDTLQGQMVTAQGNIVDLQNNKANQSEVDTINTRVGQLEDDEEWTDITNQCTFAVTPIRAFVKMRKNEISFRVNMNMGGISSGDTIITLPTRLAEGFDGVFTLIDGNSIPTSSDVAVIGQDGTTTIKAFFSGTLTDYLILSVTTAIEN